MPEQAPFSSIPVAPNLLHYFVPDPLGQILVPNVANFTFGGVNNDTIYMMADTAIWSARLKAKGASIH